MRVRRRIALVRWAIASLGAVVVLSAVVVAQTRVGSDATADFLSSVTALTNILSVIAFAIAGRSSWRAARSNGRRSAAPTGESPRITAMRTLNAATLLSMSGLFLMIYGPVALGDPAQLNPSTIVLHVLVPAFAVIELLAVPGERPVDLRLVWLVMVFPMLWFAYTFARGALAARYVYEFLDPALSGGPRTIVGMTVLILSIFFLMGVVILSLQRWRAAVPGRLV
ncbi:Pr6Pr family membrane protein [Rathayibacter tritici]|uniref:Pr6Pr family membrane protein n=1 Tax=Rathayibacter tritici TaxID=33888 RepID=UPI001473F2F1|nr:Pr6Pr family membrane protein [Rathayibacter tritici]